jgi:hypothetical protein
MPCLQHHGIAQPSMTDTPDVILCFLAAMEARDLNLARSFLAQEFTMYFPGAVPMTTLEELIEWASPRYQNVQKTFSGVEAVFPEGDTTIVYCRGTLAGKWLDGTEFENIRFIDRFELVGRQITRQDVWNDIAETKADL